jgi:hypothetical protein
MTTSAAFVIHPREIRDNCFVTPRHEAAAGGEKVYLRGIREAIYSKKLFTAGGEPAAGKYACPNGRASAVLGQSQGRTVQAAAQHLYMPAPDGRTSTVP